jgi:hypothetical protein
MFSLVDEVNVVSILEEGSKGDEKMIQKLPECWTATRKSKGHVFNKSRFVHHFVVLLTLV